MTPKEKAEEFVGKFNKTEILYHTINYYQAKQCASLAVDEILDTQPRYPSDVDWDDVGGSHKYYYEAQRQDAQNFWIEVKKEIENL